MTMFYIVRTLNHLHSRALVSYSITCVISDTLSPGSETFGVNTIDLFVTGLTYDQNLLFLFRPNYVTFGPINKTAGCTEQPIDELLLIG